MNIVILGVGEIIGSYLATMLSKENHNVTVIDKDKERLEKIANMADVATMRSRGSRWEGLAELVETKPDFFVGMTGSDEINLVTCTIAKNLGYPKTIARVKDLGFLNRKKLDFSSLFEVDHFIGAELLTAQNILKSILHPSDLAIENFAHGLVQMRTITISDNWQKKSKIKDLNLPEEMNIVLIKREDKVIFPQDDDVLLPQDEITIIGETKTLEEIPKIFKTEEEKVRSVVIVGGTSIAMRLALALESRNIKVKIIEQDEKKCEELSEFLSKTRIINRDGTYVENMIQERVFDADYFIACTNDDKRNIVISLLAKYVDCKKILCLISDMSLGPILNKEKILYTLSERVNITNRILSILYAKKIVSIASLANNKAKVFEVKISPESKLLNLPLVEMQNKLPEETLIAAVEKKGQIIVGKGSTVLEPHDTMIVISKPENLQDMEKLF